MQKARNLSARAYKIWSMEFTDYMWIKLVVLGLLAFFGNLIFTFLTGKSLSEVRRDIAEREDSSRPD